MDKEKNCINNTDRIVFYIYFFLNTSITEMGHCDFDAVVFLDDLFIEIQLATL